MSCREATPKSVEAYLREAPPATRPIVEKLRALVNEAAPELREGMKWSFLCYEGRKLVCGLGAHQQHASLMFFRGAELADPDGLLAYGEGNAAGRSFKASTADKLPLAGLRRLVRQAVKLDAAGGTSPQPRARRPALPMPEDFAFALKRAPKAGSFFNGLPPGCRREYIEWIVTAKRPETRQRRIKSALAMLADGRRHNRTSG